MRSWVVDLDWVDLDWDAPAGLDRVDDLAAALQLDDRVDSAIRVATPESSPRIALTVSAQDGLSALTLIAGLLEQCRKTHPAVEDLTAIRAADRDSGMSEARAQLPDLIWSSGITKLLGVSRQRANEIRRHPDYPSPFLDTGRDQAWLLNEVLEFEATHPRTPGRPPGRAKAD
ncbi:hypothetical protein ACFV9C_44705 [Kribbella sp. NPDC059898]|uniref:hypothetical protein n=1 Tax=Kribbella sp. NPDC059898 TaxID=3346995 RepID=UPI00365BD3AB